jgi:gluconokinase
MPKMNENEWGRVLVLVGPSGSGKSTLGTVLARELHWEFVDADIFHDAHARSKMARGEGLTDAERRPWLDRVAEGVSRLTREGHSVVLACSALRVDYRVHLREGFGSSDVLFVGLVTSRESLRRRLASREHHYAGPSLLDSQLALFEQDGLDEVVENAGSLEQVTRLLLRVVDARWGLDASPERQETSR